MTIDLIDRAGYQFAKSAVLCEQAPPRAVRRSSCSRWRSPALLGRRGRQSAAGHGPVFQVHDLDPPFLADEERQYHWSGRPWRNWDAQMRARPAADCRRAVAGRLARPRADRAEASPRSSSRVRAPRLSWTTATAWTRCSSGSATGSSTCRSAGSSRTSNRRSASTSTAPTSTSDRGYQIITTPERSSCCCCAAKVSTSRRRRSQSSSMLDHPVEIPRKNVGAEKDYGELYDAFVAALRPPTDVIDRAYSSRLVQHFYSPEEIARFREFWSVADSARRQRSARALGNLAPCNSSCWACTGPARRASPGC